MLKINISDVAVPRWVSHAGPRRLGVIMIVKNEGANLSTIFQSLRDVADEVVVVDTGSTDDTLAICNTWRVKVVSDPWRDDFARARNRSIQEATATHLLWLDGDDRLPEETLDKLRWMRDEVLPGASRKGFIFEVHNVGRSGADAFLQTRLFPRIPEARFRYRVHEQITDSLLAAGVKMVRTDVVVLHLGYSDDATRKRKATRNMELIRAELERDPKDFHNRIHLAQTLYSQGRFAEAERQLSEVIGQIDLTKMSGGFAAELHTLRAEYRLQMANRHGAIFDLERAVEYWPEWGLPHATLGRLQLAAGEPDAAWAHLERARASSFTPGIFGFPLSRARRDVELHSAHILLQRREVDAGMVHLDNALALEPNTLQLRMQIGQTLLDVERYERAREVLEPAGADESAIPFLVELSTAIALARGMTGDMDGAGACLAPLLDVFAQDLAGADDVDAEQLATVLLHKGYRSSARNVIKLSQQTSSAAA